HPFTDEGFALGVEFHGRDYRDLFNQHNRLHEEKGSFSSGCAQETTLLARGASTVARFFGTKRQRSLVLTPADLCAPERNLSTFRVDQTAKRYLCRYSKSAWLNP